MANAASTGWSEHRPNSISPPPCQGVLAARIDRLAADEKALLHQLAVMGAVPVESPSPGGHPTRRGSVSAERRADAKTVHSPQSTVRSHSTPKAKPNPVFSKAIEIAREAASEIVGAARDGEPVHVCGRVKARRKRPGRGCSRDLRLVHRRLRYERFARGQGAVGRIGLTQKVRIQPETGRISNPCSFLGPGSNRTSTQIESNSRSSVSLETNRAYHVAAAPQ